MIAERIVTTALETLTIRATCPSCQTDTDFVYQGTQHWPEHIAKKAGVPAKMTLWNCPNCRTTLSNITLDDQQP